MRRLTALCFLVAVVAELGPWATSAGGTVSLGAARVAAHGPAQVAAGAIFYLCLAGLALSAVRWPPAVFVRGLLGLGGLAMALVLRDAAHAAAGAGRAGEGWALDLTIVALAGAVALSAWWLVTSLDRLRGLRPLVRPVRLVPVRWAVRAVRRLLGLAWRATGAVVFWLRFHFWPREALLVLGEVNLGRLPAGRQHRHLLGVNAWLGRRVWRAPWRERDLGRLPARIEDYHDFGLARRRLHLSDEGIELLARRTGVEVSVVGDRHEDGYAFAWVRAHRACAGVTREAVCVRPFTEETGLDQALQRAVSEATRASLYRLLGVS
jgi:hypothetical protein